MVVVTVVEFAVALLHLEVVSLALVIKNKHSILLQDYIIIDIIATNKKSVSITFPIYYHSWKLTRWLSVLINCCLFKPDYNKDKLPVIAIL